jgi:Ala-tRNA(Pro) deacylase
MSNGVEELIFSFFKKHEISYQNHTHIPLFTVKESEEVDSKIPGGHTKNLFLKDKSGTLILVTLLGQDRLNLKAFEKEMGFGKLSFASPELLLSKLQVTPGSVTPFALLHSSSQGIRVFLDQAMMDFELLNFHPLRNDMTTTISSADFKRFVGLAGHVPTIARLPKLI